MFNHAPDDYQCPFCLIVAGQETAGVLTLQRDIIYRDDMVTAFIASHWWPSNPGHVLVIPNEHYENLYDLPLEYGGRIHAVAREVALGMKQMYQCDGISTRQHNEPAGYQDVWHYHIHVFPRYPGDELHGSSKRQTEPAEREPYAILLRQYFEDRMLDLP